MLQAKVVILRFQVNVGRQQGVLDLLPEYPGHLVAVHLDERGFSSVFYPFFSPPSVSVLLTYEFSRPPAQHHLALTLGEHGLGFNLDALRLVGYNNRRVVLDSCADILQLQLVHLIDFVIVSLIFENQRQDAGVGEVGAMDAGKSS